MKLIDVFMAFLVGVGGLQFVYCVLVGNYVSFLGGRVLFFLLLFCFWWVGGWMDGRVSELLGLGLGLDKKRDREREREERMWRSLYMCVCEEKKDC